MIKMLDIKGNGSVCKPEFIRFAKNQTLTPIGFAKPPTYEMVMAEKNRIKKEKQCNPNNMKFYIYL